MMYSASYGPVDNDDLMSILAYAETLNNVNPVANIHFHPEFYRKQLQKYSKYMNCSKVQIDDNSFVDEQDYVLSYTEIYFKGTHFYIILNSAMDGNFCIIAKNVKLVPVDSLIPKRINPSVAARITQT